MEKPRNPVGWFEIPVTDMKRAVAFYEGVFGQKLSVNEVGTDLMAWFPMVNDTYGGTGSLVKRDGFTPSTIGVLIYFTAPDIDGTLRKIMDLGGKILQPTTDIGEYGYVAYFLDTEGNRIALHRIKEMQGK